MINTAAYSYAAQAYPEDIEKVISLMEGMVGIGCSAGPVVGSFVYASLGFSWTFLTFGILMLPNTLLAYCFLSPP